MPEPGWFDVAGGKLTTYRLMAQQAVDRLEAPGSQGGTLPHGDGTAVDAGRAPTSSGILSAAGPRRAVEHYCRHEWASISTT